MPVSMLSTSLLSNKRSYSRFNALDTIYTPPSTSKPGMVLIKPTSIAHSGTSATLGENGQVTFNAVTSLSLNGVFSADFDNYVISLRHVNSSGNNSMLARLRSSGTDASGSNYTYQYLIASGTTILRDRVTGETSFWLTASSATQRSGNMVYIYGPHLAQPTATRCVSARGAANADIVDLANTHSLSTSYDGITLFMDVGSETGALQVYGVRS